MALSDMLKRLRAGKPIDHLIPRITRWIEQPRPSFREKDVWHPSEMGDMCIRRRAIHQLLPPGLIPPRELDAWGERIYRVGHWFHDGYRQDYLGPMGVLYGAWRCSRCYHTVYGQMPREACPSCQWWVGTERNIQAGLVGPDLTPRACKTFCAPTPEDEFERGYSPNAAKVKERHGCLHCGAWGEWQYRELRVTHTLPVRGVVETVLGHIDGIIDLQDARGPGVLDIKTINPQQMATLTGVSPKYRDQQMLYMGASVSLRDRLPFIPKDGVKWALVLYVNKSPQWGQDHEREFFLDFDEAEFERILDNPRRFREALADDVLPEFHPDCTSPKSKRAKTCDVCSVCFNSDVPNHVRNRSSL